MDKNLQMQLLYNEICNAPKLGNEYAIVFVYNDALLIDDKIHCSECISPTEREMIISSFSDIAKYVYPINSESDFINKITYFKEKHKYIFVYSMAQNIKGIGRRALIPLLCDFYGLHNISSDVRASIIGADKELMYNIISTKFPEIVPNTLFVHRYDNIIKVVSELKEGSYIIKPNDESASIGVETLVYDGSNMAEFINKVKDHVNEFGTSLIQEFIGGTEIEVPVLNIVNTNYCPKCIALNYKNENNFLCYSDVFMDSYTFSDYNAANTDLIIKYSISVANMLNFNRISRFDFRLKEGRPLLIDLGGNPTISTHSSTNYAFKTMFGKESSVYSFLLYAELIRKKLFEPSFNVPKH